MAKHNKKRNIGIIYELLLRQISSDLIENNLSRVKKTTSILEKHFNKNTNLYKEFRLVNALTTSNVSNSEAAAAILFEAKSAARRSSPKSLDKSKSSLIRDINYNIDDKNFYYRKVPNYIDYANVQSLINEWRMNDKSDFKKMIMLEGKVVNILLKEKHSKDVYQENKDIDSQSANKLVLKLMTEKINKKYSGLSVDQKEIIKNYAFYNQDNQKNTLVSFLQEKKNECLTTLDNFKDINKNDFISTKIENVRQKIKNLNENDLSDKSIIKFMTAIDLIKQIKEE